MIKRILGILLLSGGGAFAMEVLLKDHRDSSKPYPKLREYETDNKGDVEELAKRASSNTKGSSVDEKESKRQEKKRTDNRVKLNGGDVKVKNRQRAKSLDNAFFELPPKSSCSRRTSLPLRNKDFPKQKEDKENALSDDKEEAHDKDKKSEEDNMYQPNVHSKYYWMLVLGSLATYIGVKAWKNYQAIQKQKAKLVQKEQLQ